MNTSQNVLFLVVIKEKQNGQELPDINKYFQSAFDAKVYAQTNTRYFARHSWRKAVIKAIPI